MRKKARETNGIILAQEYSVEREIADLQLNRLLERARSGLLNYEEIKVFDLLVKNKHLAKAAEAIELVPEEPKALEAPEEAELLQIASLVTSERISDTLNVVEEGAKDGSDQDPVK
jgi:hypothetical protein